MVCIWGMQCFQHVKLFYTRMHNILLKLSVIFFLDYRICVWICVSTILVDSLHAGSWICSVLLGKCARDSVAGCARTWAYINPFSINIKTKGGYFSASGVRELHFACNCDNQIFGSKISYFFYTGNCHWNYNLHHSSDIMTPKLQEPILRSATPHAKNF